MIATRLTRAMGLDHPIISAPMAKVGGGRLAAAVSNAGGLGLIGGGYCEPDWIEAEFQKADNAHIGCGFITWRLAGQPGLLDAVLDRGPRAIFLSFGDPTEAGAKVKAANVSLICQVQMLADAKLAVGAGADIIVAQGSEAGGHGDRRATMTLVPEVADWLAANANDVLLCAAGGIADGRGLAAALMLGADGVVAGTRFWAADEALTSPAHIAAGLAADGDQTIHTKVVDIARDFDWPERFNNRVLSNPFIAKWQALGEELATNRAAKDAWLTALASGDTSIASATVGEGIGLVHATAPAAKIMQDMVDEAERLLAGSWQRNG